MKLLLILTAITLNACAAHSPKWGPEVIASAPNKDAADGYTAEDIRTCQVIVASNADACDPDGDIANGDIDAAE